MSSFTNDAAFTISIVGCAACVRTPDGMTQLFQGPGVPAGWNLGLNPPCYRSAEFDPAFGSGTSAHQPASARTLPSGWFSVMSRASEIPSSEYFVGLADPLGIGQGRFGLAGWSHAGIGRDQSTGRILAAKSPFLVHAAPLEAQRDAHRPARDGPVSLAIGLILLLLTPCLRPLVGAVPAPYGVPVAGPLIYDNSDGRNWNSTGFSSSNEFGNAITLAPAGRARGLTLGRVEIPYHYGMEDYSKPAGTVRVRIYRLAAEASPGLAPPGELLYESDPVQAGKGYNTLVLDGLGLTNIPSQLIWTVESTVPNPGDALQLLNVTPVLVGRCFNDCWMRTSNGWKTLVLDPRAMNPYSKLLVFSANFRAVSHLTQRSETSVEGLPEPFWAIFPSADMNFPTFTMDGMDTNRLVATVPLVLDSDHPVYGRVDIEPYAAAEYPVGTALKLTAVPAPGCGFRSWYGDASGADRSVSYTMNAAAAIGVRFAVEPGRFSSIRQENQKAVLEWPGTAILQETRALRGPWTDIPNARSPFTNEIVSAVRTLRLFRLRSGFEY